MVEINRQLLVFARLTHSIDHLLGPLRLVLLSLIEFLLLSGIQERHDFRPNL
jgi:hypothetical protein